MGHHTQRLDPKQKLCWENYINPESPTFGNGRQSAISAGYTESYADKIMGLQWFSSLLRRFNMRIKGEVVLEEMLDMPVKVLEWEGAGEKKEQVVVTDPTLVKIKQDTAKFAVERLGKEDWSTRQEMTGADGKDLPTPILASLNEPTHEVSSDDGS